MKKFFIARGKLTLLGILLTVFIGFFLAYLSIEFSPWKLGKLIGLCLGLALAAIGGFSGRAQALDLPPPFTGDPLGWRKAKQSYKVATTSEEGKNKDGQS